LLNPSRLIRWSEIARLAQKVFLKILVHDCLVGSSGVFGWFKTVAAWMRITRIDCSEQPKFKPLNDRTLVQ